MTLVKMSRILFILMLLLIALLSLAPVDQPSFSPNDKLNHLLAYVALMSVGYFAYRTPARLAMLLFVFGIAIEGLQGLTGYRYMSAADVLANSAGIALASIVIFVLRRFTSAEFLQGNSEL